MTKFLKEIKINNAMLKTKEKRYNVNRAAIAPQDSKVQVSSNPENE